MTTKPQAFLFSGYRFDQEQEFKKVRENLRTEMQREGDARHVR